MGKPSLQELLRIQKEHEMELKRFLRNDNDNDRRKKSMDLKVASNLDDEKDELESLENLDEDEDLAILSKKDKKILRLKKDGNRKRSPLPKKA